MHLEFLPVAENDSVPVLSTILLLPQRGFLNPDTTESGGTLDTCRNSTCAVLRTLACIRPLALLPTEGGQYHLVASRGRDDEHFDLLVQAWEPAGVRLWPQILDPCTSQETLQFFHTLLQHRAGRDLTMARK